MNKKVEINFEKSLEELESIVEDLESGDLSLENSLKSFEKQSILSARAAGGENKRRKTQINIYC